MKARLNRRARRVGAALVVALVLVATGSFLHMRSSRLLADEVRAADSGVRGALSSYFAALADGDLDRLRALTCPSYHDGFFGKVDPEQYRAVHDNEAAAGGAVVLDSIDSVLLAPPTATAQVTAHTQAVPERKQLVLALRQSDGAWQICDPEAER